MLTIYKRTKNEAGKWVSKKVVEGRGHGTSTNTGTFFVRPWINGVQERRALHSTVLKDAREEADELEFALDAQARGLTSGELSAMRNSNRLPIKSVVETYLEQKKSKSAKTRAQYRLTLHQFIEALGKIKFLDEINVDVLRKYKDFLIAEGFAGKTIDTRINIVYFMLKKNGVNARLPRDEMPTIETEVAVPYTDEQLKKMFAAMNKEEEIRYKFFLGSAARDKEVTYAAWADIDFSKGTYTVRSKPDVAFTVKNHESRTVPLPDSLVAMLKGRKKKAPHGRWIFVNEEGRPDNHFLRKLKRIAFRAGVNCGQCKTVINKARYGHNLKEVTCATDPVCEHIYLHRLRKTCATRWMEAGIPVRTIQHYLGHKSLETTMFYLGVADSDKMRGAINQAFGD